MPLRSARPGHVEALAAALIERDEEVGAEVARGEVDARRAELLLREKRLLFFFGGGVEKGGRGRKKVRRRKSSGKKKTFL